MAYATEELAAKLHDVNLTSLGTGTMGFANKGAVGVHLR